MKDLAEQKGGKDFCVPDEVFIGFCAGIESSMKGRCFDLNLSDANLRRKIGIQCTKKSLGLKLTRGLNGSDLSDGMNSGIGATGGLDMKRFFPEFF